LLAWAGLANAQIGNFPALLGARGTSLPSTCQIGQLFFKTDATAGSNIYGCTAANTWTVSSFNSSTFPTLTGTPAAGDLSYWTGASSQALLTPNGSLILGGSSSAPTNYAGSTVTAGQVVTAISNAGAVTGVAPSTLSNITFTSGTSRTIAAPAEIIVCTSTCTVTPPGTLTAGWQFCVQNDDNVSTVITLAAVANIQYEATARTSYGGANKSMTSNGAVANQICMVAISTTKYNVFSSVGTWTNTP